MHWIFHSQVLLLKALIDVSEHVAFSAHSHHHEEAHKEPAHDAEVQGDSHKDGHHHHHEEKHEAKPDEVSIIIN